MSNKSFLDKMFDSAENIVGGLEKARDLSESSSHTDSCPTLKMTYYDPSKCNCGFEKDSQVKKVIDIGGLDNSTKISFSLDEIIKLCNAFNHVNDIHQLNVIKDHIDNRIQFLKSNF